MNAIASPRVFEFESAPVRSFVRDDEPWFVGVDVCRALDLANPNQAMSRLDDDERYTLLNVEGIAKAGGAQALTIISEPGVYRLVFTSRTAKAEAFKRWLAHEVLPALRRTGRFELAAPAEDQDRLPVSDDQRLWGVPLPKIAAAARFISVARTIYGVEAARRLWEREPDLPAIGPMASAPGECAVARFAREMIVREASMRLPAHDAYRAFQAFCLESGEPDAGYISFCTRFSRLGFVKRYAHARGRSGRSVYLGIAVRSDPAFQDDE
jgi:prophage antirepressor-like protein